MFRGAIKKQREIDLATARLKKMNQDRKIGEILEGIKSNQLLLLDIKIDQEKLKLIALRRKVGSPDDFAPPSGE
jgi:mevalonate kinase